jgi:hypothetical protein
MPGLAITPSKGFSVLAKKAAWGDAPGPRSAAEATRGVAEVGLRLAHQARNRASTPSPRGIARFRSGAAFRGKRLM